MISIEIGLSSNRVKKFYEATNSDRLRTNLDLLEETRAQAHIKIAAYKQRVIKYYNTRMKSKSFQKGDLILRRAEVSKSNEQDKLAPNWKRPYQIIDVIGLGAYRIENLNGSCIPRT